MAGNFILKSITQSDLSTAIRFPHIRWSDTAHRQGTLINPAQPQGARFPGWTVTTRQTLSNALANVAIGNRQNLPPHRYLEISAWAQLNDDEKGYVRGAGWADSLVYPNGAGLGLKAMTGAVLTAWNLGNKNQALEEALKQGNVSIEVFYQSGMEMY
jgi:hypothetical protein